MHIYIRSWLTLAFARRPRFRPITLLLFRFQKGKIFTPRERSGERELSLKHPREVVIRMAQLVIFLHLMPSFAPGPTFLYLPLTVYIHLHLHLYPNPNHS